MMMDRKRFEQLLPDYIENNLSGSDLADFNAWIGAHPEDRTEVAELRRLILDVSDIEVPDPGAQFWDRFLPHLRTRMDLQAEKPGLLERLRSIVLRPAMIGSVVIATLILVLLTVFSNMGPRGEAVMEARRVNSRLETALRGAEDDPLALLEGYFDQQSIAGETGAPLGSARLTMAAADPAEGGETWLDPWIVREETRDLNLGGTGTYRLLADLDEAEAAELLDMLRSAMTAG